MIYDKDIREPLFEFLEIKYGKTRFIEEKRMGKSRADVVMIRDGAVCGIEIKSDADTYARLDRQVKDYDQYFDYNYVVIGSTHAAHIKEHVPESWGIISVEVAADSGSEKEDITSGEIDFYVIREPERNPKLDWVKKLSILWRPELAMIQEKNNMAAYKNKSKAFVIDKIIEKVPQEILVEQISDTLFERDYTQIAEQINAFRVANGRKPRRKTAKRKRKYKAI